MTSRRALLAGLGAVGVTGLAGCSALPFGDGDDAREDVSLPSDVVDPIDWPASPFPVAVPDTLADAHRERGRELLSTVPTDPSVPNAAIAAELRSDREHAADRLSDPVEEPWPIDGLSRWRDRRTSAATVRGAYRAATGEDEGASVAERRRAIREEFHSFVAEHAYRAPSSLEAVLAHASLEDLMATGRRQVRPTPSYPAEPIARPFQAGEAVGGAEAARATLADARRLREVYLSARSDAPSQWATLIDASDRLRFAVGRTRSSVREFLETEDSPFEADLEGTAGQWLFLTARRRVESGVEEHAARREDGDYAGAVIEAGRTLAAVEALRTAIDGIRGGSYRDPVTVESVRRTASRAREAITAIDIGDDAIGRLATRIARPTFETFEYVPERIAEGYARADRVQGDLARTELYARAVPAAAAFVRERLQ